MHKKFLLISSFSLLLFLTGCISPLAGQTDISVVMSGSSYQPASWRVPAGALITLHLTNNDSTPHEWTILFRQAIIPFDANDQASIYWSVSISPGKSTTVQFDAPQAAGNYEVVSPDSLKDGMVGRLTVIRLDDILK